MNEIDKARIISLWEGGMTLGQIRQMTPVPARVFDAVVREMKKNGEFPMERKNAEAKVIDAYHRGERNPYEIAEELGITPNSVRTFFGWNKLRKGKKTRHWVHCERTNDIIKDLQEGELSQVEIARKHQVTKQYITKIKRKLEKWGDAK